MLHWKQLTNLPDEVLTTYDIALVNLACTAALPDAPSPLTIRECLQKLDEWAKFVRHYTEMSYEQFFRKDPAKYEYSEALFRSVCLNTALQRHRGLRYNPAKKAEDAVFGTADSFIHGAIVGDGGTCASIPVVLAAVGRRLGYPIKIAETKGVKWGHVFARWDDPSGERLNLEATGKGLSTPDDDYYRTGRYALDLKTEKNGQFLKSLTPREELASFLFGGFRWRDLRQWRCVGEAFATASGLVPANVFYLNTLKVDMNTWLAEQKRQKPPGFPEVYIQTTGRCFPEGLPLEIEQKILGQVVWDNLLSDARLNVKYWEPMRRGVKLPRVPKRVEARFSAEKCAVELFD